MNAEPRRVVMATGNKAKLAEIRPLLDGSGIVVCAQSEFDFIPADETGQTFLENALLKARAAATATGLIAIADDSGLCVDALDGRPGVHSARFAGANATDADNVDKLLQQMQAVDDDRRGAAFHCAAVVVFPEESQDPLIASGEWRGQIAATRSGNSGFGYDPVFVDPQFGKSAAEMTAEQKNARSHRGQAFRQLKDLLLAALAVR